MNPLNLVQNTQSQNTNAQQYLTTTQIVSPIKKETLIKPKNHNLFNNPDYFRYTRGQSAQNINAGGTASRGAVGDSDGRDDQSQKTRKDNFVSSEKKFFYPENQKSSKFISINQPYSPSFDAVNDDGFRSGFVSPPDSQNNSVRNVARNNYNSNPMPNNQFNNNNIMSPREFYKSGQTYSNNVLKSPKDNIGAIDEFNYKSQHRNRPQIFQNNRNNLNTKPPQSKQLTGINNNNQLGSQIKQPYFTSHEKDKNSYDFHYDFSHIKELNQDNFLKYIHPKQRETIYLLFGEKRDHWQQSWQNQNQNEKDLILGDPIFNKNQETALTYYEKLDLRAEKLKDRLRDTSKIVSHMMERRKKFLLEHEELIKSIEKYKDTLEITQKTSKKKVFERDIQLLVEQIKLKIEDLKDKYREANDLIVIFSIASNHYLNNNQNWSSSNNNTMIDLNKNKPTNNQGSNISKADSNYKFLQTTYNYQSVFHQSSNMLDFDSRALQIYQEFQQQIRNLDSGLNEYKKYLKLDIEGEEFNIRTQELLQILKQCQLFTTDAEKEIILLNQELGNNLKEIAISLKQNVEFYTRVYQSIEESFDLVCKLMYLSQSKFKEMNEQITDATKDIEVFVQKCYRRKQMQQKNINTTSSQSQTTQQQTFGIGSQFISNSSSSRFQTQYVQSDDEIKRSALIIQQKIGEITSSSSNLKKQVKQLAIDPRCQYFIQLRFKKCTKVMDKLQTMNCQVDNLQRFFQLVSSRLDEDLNEIIHFQEQMKKISNDFAAVTQIKEHKKLIEMLFSLYQACIQLMSSMGNSIIRLNCYIAFNQIGSIQKNFVTIQSQLQTGIQEIGKLQEKILQETKKKGRSEEFEQNMKKLEVFSELCQKEIESFRKQRDQLFYIFNEAERTHSNNSAMIALGSARQAFQIIQRQIKEEPTNPHLLQIQKQITQQKNTLELCNCIIDNSSFLQISNFQQLEFTFKQKDNKIEFDTNLDEILQGVDESMKNIVQCWETVRQQPYDKFLTDVTERIIEMIRALNEFISFWMKGLKVLVKKIKAQMDIKNLIKKELQQKIINEQIEPFLNFLNERIQRNFSANMSGIINFLAQKVHECCLALIIFVYEGVQKEVSYHNIENVVTQLEELLNHHGSSSSSSSTGTNKIINLPVLYQMYRCVAFIEVEKQLVAHMEDIPSRVKLLRSRITEIYISQVEGFMNQKDYKIVLMLNFFKDIVVNESILHYKEQIDSLIDFSIHLNSRLIRVQEIIDDSKMKWKSQIYVSLDANENSFFCYIMKYYEMINKYQQFDSTINTLINNSPEELRQKMIFHKERNNKTVLEALKLSENIQSHSQFVQELIIVIHYFQALSIYKQHLMNQNFYFIEEQSTQLRKLSHTISSLYESLIILKDSSIIQTLVPKYLANPTEEKQQLFQNGLGIFLGINGYSRIVELRDSETLENWIQIFSQIQEHLSDMNTKQTSIKSFHSGEFLSNFKINILTEEQNTFINKMKTYIKF